jgi:hypothetical protein
MQRVFLYAVLEVCDLATDAVIQMMSPTSIGWKTRWTQINQWTGAFPHYCGNSDAARGRAHNTIKFHNNPVVARIVCSVRMWL